MLAGGVSPGLQPMNRNNSTSSDVPSSFPINSSPDFSLSSRQTPLFEGTSDALLLEQQGSPQHQHQQHQQQPFKFSDDIVRPLSTLPTVPLHSVTDVFLTQGRGHLKQILSLDLPRLPPALGTLVQPTGAPYNYYTEKLRVDGPDRPVKRGWKPRPGIQVFSTAEHGQAVNRLAVSQDQLFFASCSSDKTVKIWEVAKHASKKAHMRSSLTYSMHKAPVVDCLILDNSHSVVSCSTDGDLHLWRVDVASTVTNRMSSQVMAPTSSSSSSPSSSVEGTTVIKEHDVEQEGGVSNLMSFNTDRASIVMYTTQRGRVHSWDLRSSKEPFSFAVPPEYGSVLSACQSGSKSGYWFCLGTSLGYILLYDLRYNMLSGLWRISTHTPIMKLASSNSIPGVVSTGGPQDALMEGVCLFVASGNNECSIFSIPDGGEALKSFRSRPLSFASLGQERNASEPLPSLTALSPLYRPPLSPVIGDRVLADHHPSVVAMMGRISSHSSYLLTGGTDRRIRFWDYMSSARCFTLSGDPPNHPQSSYDSPSVDGAFGKLFVCHEFSTTPQDLCLSSQLPLREERGLTAPSLGHTDTITDLKSVELPIRMVLSSSKDGTVKGWG